MEIREIEIAEIRFNPENPRKHITPEVVAARAASIKVDGLLEHIVVRELTPEELAEGGMGCTGAKPAKYESIEGEIRTRAKLMNGDTHILSEILKGRRRDFDLKAFKSNDGVPYHWLDRCTYIARYVKTHKDLSMRQVAAVLELDHSRVSRACKVIALLNEGAIAKIEELINTQDVAELQSGAENTKTQVWDIPETVIVALTGLTKSQPSAEGRYSAEDVDNMEKSLRLVIAHKMPEKQVKKLAEWVKAGNKPEDFGKKAENTGQNQNFSKSGPFRIKTANGISTISLQVPENETQSTVNALMEAMEVKPQGDTSGAREIEQGDKSGGGSNAEFGMRNAESKMPNAELASPNAGSAALTGIYKQGEELKARMEQQKTAGVKLSWKERLSLVWQELVKICKTLYGTLKSTNPVVMSNRFCRRQ